MSAWSLELFAKAIPAYALDQEALRLNKIEEDQGDFIGGIFRPNGKLLI